VTESSWIALALGFLTLEGSILAAWISLRERVIRAEVGVQHLQGTFAHIAEENDSLRENLARHVTRLELLEQRMEIVIKDGVK
jgi:hypothetical protein